jgi:hypothetical protein
VKWVRGFNAPGQIVKLADKDMAARTGGKKMPTS